MQSYQVAKVYKETKLYEEKKTLMQIRRKGNEM
jgi:hypothetical protein